MLIKAAAVIGICIAMCLMAINRPHQETAPPTPADLAASGKKFAALSDEFMKQSLAMSPTSASDAGSA